MEIIQKENEPRFVYLMRIAAKFIYNNCSEGTIVYDESTCDGYCLSNELEDMIDSFYE